MNRQAFLSRPLRLILAATLAAPVAITLAASPVSPAQAALGGLTPFEIDSNTVAAGGTDWASKFADGQVAVANDENFGGDAVVQTDVGSDSAEPDWLADCVHSTSDTVFKNSTNIDDADWTADHETQAVDAKNDICQSYFSFDVVDNGSANDGHIVAYVAFTRRVFNGDGSYYFILSKGPNPDIRVDGDIVIEVDYDSSGNAQHLLIAEWQGAGPTLSDFADIGVDNPNVELSPVQYFAEMAIDLTALGLAPDVDQLPTPEACTAFGFGRVISRTGNSQNATLKDDGEPTGLDFNVCGSLIVKKELTASVPGTHEFPVVVTPPAGVTMDGEITLAVPGDPFVFPGLPPSAAGYNVWETLTGDLANRWDLVSVVCQGDNGTPDDPSDDPDPITLTGPDDTFPLGSLETVTCTVTNAPAPAVINVDKDAGDADGTWPVNLSGDASDSVNVTDDGTIDFVSAGTFATFGEVPAGNYTLTEGDEAGGGAFRPSGWSCTVVGGATSTESGDQIDITANPGDVVNCTITNTPVPPPNVDVVKTALPTSFPEPATAPGNPIVYSVEVKNAGTEPFTIDNLTDAVEGGAPFDLDAAQVDDEAGLAGATITANDCGDLIGDTVAPGDSAFCSFSVAYTDRNAADVIDDRVTAYVSDDFGQTDNDFGDASVTVTNVPPTVTIVKDDGGAGVNEPGGDVTYTLDITNTSDEDVTVTELSDTITYEIDTQNSTVVDLLDIGAGDPVSEFECHDASDATIDITTYSIAPDETVTCTFVVTLAGSAQNVHDVASVVVVDDENTPGDDSDDEDTPIGDVPPTVTIDKSDNPTSVDELGGNVTYTLDITNTSNEDVTVTDLSDTITYALDAGNPIVVDLLDIGAGDPVSGFECHDASDDPIDITAYLLAPDETVTCTFVVALAGEPQNVHDVAHVVVVDNDNSTGEDEDTEDTPINNLPPAVSIEKTADPIVINVTGSVEYTFVIQNLSEVEDLTLATLVDNRFGNIFNECVTDGMDTVLTPNDHADGGGDQTTCTIERTLSEIPGTTHTNEVTVTGHDNEGGTATATDQASVRTIAPNTAVAKSVQSATRDAATGIWTIVYDVTVTNSGEGEAILDVRDELHFGGGVHILPLPVGVSVASPGVTLHGGFDGDDDTLIASNVILGPGNVEPVSKVFTITVKATIDGPAAGEGSCVSEAPNRGFLNTVTVTSNFGDPVSASACAPFSVLTLVKHKVADGDPTVNDVSAFTLTASANGATHVSGQSGVTQAVPPGSYQLAESNVPGYTPVAPGFDCSHDAQDSGSSVDLAAGEHETCTITNDLESSIEITALAPECVQDAPFIRYAIAPSGFTPTGGATLSFFDRDGNFVESVHVSSLSGTVIYPGAEVDAQGNGIDWPGWKFENGLWVVDPTDARLRDGLRVDASVNPTASADVTYPPATSACANPQQVSTDMAIVKDASVPQVGAGGGFTWLLNVTNNGPDPATNVSVSDVVPGQVTVTGVTSAQFSCSNSGNTVTCTKPGMAVGESGVIAIAVTVPAAAASGTVTNIGSVTAAQPESNLSNNSDDASVTIVAQAPPPPTPPPVVLPPTGSNSTTPVTWAAISLVLIGGLVLLVSRRRRDHPSVN